VAFTGKTVWITGASSGIGEALARAFIQAGANVILSARRMEELERVKRSCGAPDRVSLLPFDLAEAATLPAMAETALKMRGGIDVLINNGGISQRALVKDTSLEVDRRIMEVNYFAAVALTKAVLPNMLLRGRGQVVAISSVVGYVGTPMRSAYSASKHALHGFYESLRAELHGTGVGVTLVCPGFIRTNVSFAALGGDGTPHGKMADLQAKGMDPDDCAARILEGVDAGKPEILVGGARELSAIYLRRFVPNVYRKVITRVRAV